MGGSWLGGGVVAERGGAVFRGVRVWGPSNLNTTVCELT